MSLRGVVVYVLSVKVRGSQREVERISWELGLTGVVPRLKVVVVGLEMTVKSLS